MARNDWLENGLSKSPGISVINEISVTSKFINVSSVNEFYRPDKNPFLGDKF